MNDHQTYQKKHNNVKLHKNNSMNIKNKIPIQAINNTSSKLTNVRVKDILLNKKQISNIKLNYCIKTNPSKNKIPLTKQKNINAFKSKLGQLQLNISNFSYYNKNISNINSITNKNNLTKIMRNKIPNTNINNFITLQRNITFNNNIVNNLSKNISHSRSKSKSNSKNLSKELMNDKNKKKTILEKYIKQKYLEKKNIKINLNRNASFNKKQNQAKKSLAKQKNKSSNLLITKFYKIKNSNIKKRNNSKNLSNNFSSNNSISKKNNSLCNNNTNSLINNSINKKYLDNKQIMYFMKKKKLNKTKNCSYKDLENKNKENQKLICINNYTNKNNNYLINERLKTEYCCEDDNTVNNFLFSKKYSKKNLLNKNLYSNDDNKELIETESPLKLSTDKTNKDNSDALSFEEVKDIIIYNNFTNVDIKKGYLFRKGERNIFKKNNETKYIEFFFKEKNETEKKYNKLKPNILVNNNEMFSIDTEYSSKMKTKVNKNLVKNIKVFN